MIQVAGTVSSMYVTVWVFAAFFGRYTKMQVAKSIKAELQPLYLPAVVVCYLTGAHPWAWWNILGLVSGVLNYFLFRGDDDDRWKRRRKKLAEKIEQRGTRLVVVPAGGGS